MFEYIEGAKNLDLIFTYVSGERKQHELEAPENFSAPTESHIRSAATVFPRKAKDGNVLTVEPPPGSKRVDSDQPVSFGSEIKSLSWSAWFTLLKR